MPIACRRAVTRLVLVCCIDMREKTTAAEKAKLIVEEAINLKNEAERKMEQVRADAVLARSHSRA